MKLSFPGLLVTLGAALQITACATMAPPEPPSLELPKPPSDLRAARKGDKVTLTWTVPSLTTDRQTVRNLGPTRICRGIEPQLTECGTPVGIATTPPRSTNTSAQKIADSYSDTLPEIRGSGNPLSSITYAVEVLNREGHGAGLSNQVHVPLAYTLPPAQDFSAKVTAEGVVLSWTGQAPPTGVQTARFVYRIYRVQEGGQQRIPVGDVAAKDGALSFTDSSIEWEKTYVYSAEAVTTVSTANQRELQVEGEVSPEVKVFADDIFPPAVPSGLQAVFSGTGQEPFIDLIWAPVADMDLAGYNVYRQEEESPPVKINSQLAKTPSFRDANVVSGETYSYSVSAIDVRGNESARSEETSEKVP